MSDLQKNLERVAAFNEPYRDQHLESASDTNQRDDPFRLRFFLKNAMAGRRHESTSRAYREAAEAVFKEHQQKIKNRLNGDEVFLDDDFNQELERAGLTNGADRQMVIEVVDLLADIGEDYDIVDYTIQKVETGAIDVVYDQLTDIHNIAQKKATLFLRDVVTIWESESELSWEDYRYVFPVDTQVRQVVVELEIVDVDSTRNQLINSVLNVCKPRVSPIAFNQGAWYLGANAFDVLMNNIGALEPSS